MKTYTREEKTGNWYNELKEIEREHGAIITDISVEGVMYPSIEDAKTVLDVAFDDSFGVPEGKPFRAWSDKRVYFPHEYDGAERVEWVYRNPVIAPENEEHIS